MTNNQTKEESLARWVAEKVGDEIREATSAISLMVRIKASGSYSYVLTDPKNYLNCKNVAGRLFDWYEKEKLPDGQCYFNDEMFVDAMADAWSNTPAAIEELAKACGWTAPKEKK